jgi:UDP-N-acetylglucosamine diphosphorylase/glucosamine-1-phosphate N-acetyltransferase
MMQILLIEQDDVRLLWPFSATHCSWELRYGHFTILERWQRVAAPHSVCVSSPRRPVEAAFMERYGQDVAELSHVPTLVMASNAALSVSTMRSIIASVADRPMRIVCGTDTIGVFLPTPFGTITAINDSINALGADDVDVLLVDGTVISGLWQIYDLLKNAISDDASLVDRHTASTAHVHPTAVLDTRHGPILIDEGAIIEPLAVVMGPVSIGRQCLVKPHTTLRTVVLGPLCKVAGELDTVVMQGYGSKQHGGFAGHSYLCEWTNLGAGSITSNLLNTYGMIVSHLPSGRVSTERMFVGLAMGEHSKSAIGTTFMTGTNVGVCANVVTPEYPPALVPSFMWKDNASPRVTLQKALATARTVMLRRSVQMGPNMEALITSIHEHGDV